MDSHDPSESRQLQIADNYQRTRNIIIGALFASMLLQMYVWWVVQGPERPADALMEFHAATVTGSNALCPGETLTYTVDLHVSGPGVFMLAVVTWRIDPPSFAIYEAQPRYLVFAGPQEYTLPRQWTVPATITDPTTNAQVAWTPGAYERRHAISTVSRSTEPSIVTIPFTIRGDCP